VSFLVSALLIVGYVQRRPAASAGPRRSLLRDMAEGTGVVMSSPVLRSTMLIAWVGAAFAVVPEGLAVTYAHARPVATGVLTAAAPFGTVVGALVLARLVRPARRVRLLVPLALGTFVPLTLTALRPSIALTAVLWALTGAGMTYSLPANALFVASVPNEMRGRAFGLAQAGLQIWQGVALAVAGALALRVPAHQVVALSGVAGLVCIAVLAVRWPYGALRATGAPAPARAGAGEPLVVTPDQAGPAR
jgi:MFS family permease